tara:strand:+ start:1256 stop:1909 length:654 start_codon:yes stop_codon:yes gene_type:complete
MKTLKYRKRNFKKTKRGGDDSLKEKIEKKEKTEKKEEENVFQKLLNSLKPKNKEDEKIKESSENWDDDFDFDYKNILRQSKTKRQSKNVHIIILSPPYKELVMIYHSIPKILTVSNIKKVFKELPFDKIELKENDDFSKKFDKIKTNAKYLNNSNMLKEFFQLKNLVETERKKALNNKDYKVKKLQPLKGGKSRRVKKGNQLKKTRKVKKVKKTRKV